LLIAVAVLVGVQEYVAPSRSSLLAQALFDAGHAPLFGLVALAVLGLSRALVSRPLEHHDRHYLLAFLACAAAGVATEVVQIGGPRSAEIGDVVRDICGGGAFLMLSASVDPVLRRVSPAAFRRRRPWLWSVSAGLLALVALPVVPLAVARLHRDAVFPLLCGFDSRWERGLVEAEGAELERVPLPPAWRHDAGDLAGRVTFRPVTYPKLRLLDPYPDWSGFERLAMTIYSELSGEVELSLTVADPHNQRFRDRFTRRLRIEPGVNAISIPLEEVRSAPAGRTMDMRHIRGVMLYAVRPKHAFTLYIDDIRLD
jgi:hypothetical protein